MEFCCILKHIINQCKVSFTVIYYLLIRRLACCNVLINYVIGSVTLAFYSLLINLMNYVIGSVVKIMVKRKIIILSLAIDIFLIILSLVIVLAVNWVAWLLTEPIKVFSACFGNTKIFIPFQQTTNKRAFVSFVACHLCITLKRVLR